MRLAFFGGIYSNYLALEAAIRDAQSRGTDALYCLGDLGAFGPHPDRVFPLLHDNGVLCIRGNYDDSIGRGLEDCQCGYTDPRDNHFARISYEYTFANTSVENREWMRTLPGGLRFEIDGLRFLLCHGSPRKINEFLWESTTSTHFLEKLADNCRAEVILGTHTGLHWQRRLSGGRRFVNVGVLGRPANDGRTSVWYAMVRTGRDTEQGGRRRSGVRSQQSRDRRQASGVGPGGSSGSGDRYSVEFIPLEYDHQRLAREMRDEKLPDEFVETILTGWWTTCLEVLPARERRRGRF